MLTIIVFCLLIIVSGVQKTFFSPSYEEFHLYKKEWPVSKQKEK
ncbi:hypothetical protein [Alkalihalobacillus sp. LMS39]|nr:hypothetical protein [Alkalihalobacillus sp. LMS39]